MKHQSGEEGLCWRCDQDSSSHWLSSRDLWSGRKLRECLTAPQQNLHSYIFFLLVGASYDHSLFRRMNAIFVLQGAKSQLKTSGYCTMSERLFYYAHQAVITFIGVPTYVRNYLKGDIDFE